MFLYSTRGIVLLTLLFLSLIGNSQEYKIGFVDTVLLMKDSPQAETARKKLENEFRPRDQKIVEMQKDEKQLEDQLGIDTSAMPDAERKKLERNLQTIKRDIKRAREEIIEDYNLRRNEEINRLQKVIDKITIDIAKEEQYDVILRDNVLYSSKRINITEKVLERLRQQQGRVERNTTETPPPPGR